MPTHQTQYFCVEYVPGLTRKAFLIKNKEQQKELGTAIRLKALTSTTNRKKVNLGSCHLVQAPVWLLSPRFRLRHTVGPAFLPGQDISHSLSPPQDSKSLPPAVTAPAPEPPPALVSPSQLGSRKYFGFPQGA